MNLTILRLVFFLLADSEIAFSKTGFELKLKSILWFLIHGSQVVMVLWFRKSSVFYLPPGWFGPLDRLLCLPFSPVGKITPSLWIGLCTDDLFLFFSVGSVSVAVWFAACRRFIKAIALTVNDFVLTPAGSTPS
jgi:hypothetical protein